MRQLVLYARSLAEQRHGLQREVGAWAVQAYRVAPPAGDVASDIHIDLHPQS